jgi:glycosyltransferase involved in cell wall biosynthesis
MISIIIPAYNVSDHIQKTLHSVLSQNHDFFEVILVDDGSTDNTHEVVQKLLVENQPKNVKVIRKKNEGVSSARNRGIEEAGGKYILFLDGDDLISPNLVEHLMPVCNEKEPDIICWGYDIVTEDMEMLLKYEEKYAYEYQEMSGEAALQNMLQYRYMHICMGNALYKKELLAREKIRFNDGCTNGEDREFILKCLAMSKSVIFLPQTLFYYVQRKRSATKSFNMKRFEAIAAVERASRFVEEKNPKLFSRLETQFRYELILEQFLYNFNTCYDHLLTQQGLNYRKARQQLLYELESHWPGLYNRMINLMKNYSGKNLKFVFRIKCFQISPCLYFWLLKIKKTA